MRLNFYLFIFYFLSQLFNVTHAGLFTTPHFIAPGEFAIGAQPEIFFQNGANVGIDLRYTHGLSDLNNVIGTIGTGSGNRNFRAGTALTFDIFPDIEKQPGIGVAFQGLFVQKSLANAVEVTVTPYIHKTLISDNLVIEPFFGIPTGLNLSQGHYKALASLVIGSLFEHNEHFRSSIEFGIGLTSVAYSYFGCGVSYYH